MVAARRRSVNCLFGTPGDGKTGRMSQTDEVSQPGPESENQSLSRRANDDRRGEVKPTDSPVPSSPEPDRDAVREGEEKLERVKPY